MTRLPKWKEIITVKTWIKSLENSRSTRCFELYIDDKKIVGCETFWAVFNTKTRRPEALALPHEHFEKYPENSATEKPFSKINVQQTFEFISEHIVRLSDLDIVNHANSIKYLEWCIDYIDSEILLNQDVKAFEMNYLKEVSLSDILKIERNKNTFILNNQEKTCFALQLELK
jgi:acyl-ACP thioesterase